jgi:histidine triad (HIT) family protein
MDCTFCSICSGDVDAEVLEETDESLAFAPLPRVSEGHTLVIPKEHYETMFDIPETTLSVVEHAGAISRRLQASGFDARNDSNGSFRRAVPISRTHQYA